MKKLLLSILLATLFLGMMSPAIAAHNSDSNGCDTADTTINVTATGVALIFSIDGEDNPIITVDSGSCVKIIFDNVSDLDHDFTIVDDVTDSANPVVLIEMTAAAGITIEHLWLMPDYEVNINYFCEVEGHRGSGMEGAFIIDDGSSSLPGFGFAPAFLAITFLIAIPIIKNRKN